MKGGIISDMNQPIACMGGEREREKKWGDEQKTQQHAAKGKLVQQ